MKKIVCYESCIPECPKTHEKDYTMHDCEEGVCEYCKDNNDVCGTATCLLGQFNIDRKADEYDKEVPVYEE